MDRNLALEVVRVTEAAALYASRLMGRGDAELANRAATEAMAQVFLSVSIRGRIVSGGEYGNSPFARGMIVGTNSGSEVDIAIDPLDGKTTCANGGNNAITAIAMGEKDSLFSAPQIYMEKIAVGPEARGVVDITQPPEINIKRVARAKDKYIEDVTVCVLDRERHRDLIASIRQTGARIKLINDGDISGAVATAMDGKAIDILMGSGGAMQGVVAAAALKCLGGDIQARFVYRNEDDKRMVLDTGEKDLDRIYGIGDMAKGNIVFAATGITNGELLPGVLYVSGGAQTHSVVMRSKTRTVRFITAMHQFDYKPMY
ncbi:MAG: class II fructose-bisphosphatase [Spirochaetes bacterium]|jgi:fructose-1,6-bisphosphatase II|nr:class II fructose-bisphosphatase [Spirochaetota bacterium]